MGTSKKNSKPEKLGARDQRTVAILVDMFEGYWAEIAQERQKDGTDGSKR